MNEKEEKIVSFQLLIWLRDWLSERLQQIHYNFFFCLSFFLWPSSNAIFILIHYFHLSNINPIHRASDLIVSLCVSSISLWLYIFLQNANSSCCFFFLYSIFCFFFPMQNAIISCKWMHVLRLNFKIAYFVVVKMCIGKFYFCFKWFWSVISRSVRAISKEIECVLSLFLFFRWESFFFFFHLALIHGIELYIVQCSASMWLYCCRFHTNSMSSHTRMCSTFCWCVSECVVCYCLRKNIVKKKESARERRGRKKRTRWRKQNLETQRWLCIGRSVFSEKWVSISKRKRARISFECESRSHELNTFRDPFHWNTHEKLVYFYCLCQLCAHRAPFTSIHVLYLRWGCFTCNCIFNFNTLNVIVLHIDWIATIIHRKNWAQTFGAHKEKEAKKNHSHFSWNWICERSFHLQTKIQFGLKFCLASVVTIFHRDLNYSF